MNKYKPSIGNEFSNRTIDVTSIGRDDFEKVLSLFFSNNTKAVAYSVGATTRDRTWPIHEGGHSIRKLYGLVLYWSMTAVEDHAYDTEQEVHPLPFEMNLEHATDFAWGWFESAGAKFMKDHLQAEPDHDGHNIICWRMFNEGWTHVAGNPYGIVCIEPDWAMYGK